MYLLRSDFSAFQDFCIFSFDIVFNGQIAFINDSFQLKKQVKNVTFMSTTAKGSTLKMTIYTLSTHKGAHYYLR